MTLTLALLCVFTIAAGAAVARLMPARLALFQLPQVSGQQRPIAPDALSVAGSGSGTTTASPSPAGVAARLAPLIDSGGLGRTVGALVVNLKTGQVLYTQNADDGFAPASTTKVATAVAAITTLGAQARFTTSVVLAPSGGSGAGRSIMLIGGGDPTLSAGRYPAAFYPQPASLVALARQAAATLRAKSITSVRLTYDNTLFTGPTLAPGWPGFGSANNYITTGNVAPITGLEVDQGRLTSSGQPQDYDDPSNYLPRSMTPGRDAARAFASFLRKDGIAVRNVPVSANPAQIAGKGPLIASVKSATLAQMVQWMLQESNNVIAETLARQVAIATGRPATFAGAAAAVMAVDARLGVNGIHLHDGSGLSPLDRIEPSALVRLIELASSARDPALRPVITGFPVAGFAGTLGPGSSFGPFGPVALGTVRAKTGNITGVATMAGIAYAKDGSLLAFAFMGNGISDRLGLSAESMLSQLATQLAGCGCG
jgi:D-alanyl-D-alanine carboxypeptidase/D-alanyl-D-alanine-endopeptidase (penicillin-binding protein 4)